MGSDPQLFRRGNSLLRALVCSAVALFGLVTLVPLAETPAGAATKAPSRVGSLDSPSVVLEMMNAIRHGARLPAATPTSAYSADLSQALASNVDPALPPPTGPALEEFALWGVSTFAPGVRASAADVVNAWVYHDGWLGSNTWNLACPSPGAPGCDGHRRAVLSRPPVPGAHLVVDIGVSHTDWQGQPAVEVVALLVWEAPAS